MSIDERIFDAVFPAPSEVGAPTPAATPVLGSSSFGFSNDPPKVSQVTAQTAATEQIIWEKCWHTATTFLSLADRPIDCDQDERSLLTEWFKPYTEEVHDALVYLAPGMLTGRMRQNSFPRDDLLAWYLESAAFVHYSKYVLPDLLEHIESESPSCALARLTHILHMAQLVYLFPIKEYFAGILPEGVATVQEIVYRLRTLLTMKLPQDWISTNLVQLFRDQTTALVHDDSLHRNETNPSHELEGPLWLDQSDVRLNQTLQQTGLGGNQARGTLAAIMFDVLRQHVKDESAGNWSSSSSLEGNLRTWTADHFASFVNLTLKSLEDIDIDERDYFGVNQTDVEQWQAMSLNQLGRLRTDELFDIVIRWDGTKSAIEELRGFVTNTVGRNFVVNRFNAATAHRLLHPGASTIEILQVYVNIIRAFTALDPKGVLLDRVSRPIRRYLRERDDTVNIVVGGLLANPDIGDDEQDYPHTEDVLVDLAAEMDMNNAIKSKDIDDTDLDFDDMDWHPDPVDASPDYKKTRNFDVIDSLISLFESKQIFVAEFQKVLGERLLRAEYDFDRETRVLELLKLRFDESTLQACEVMLRDILDSRRVDASIQKDRAAATLEHNRDNKEPLPALRARILSHLFWPPLHSETFLVPPPIIALRDSYSQAFESLKASRKLTWLHALGQVTVDLDLEDRTVTEVVQTWQAAVIYAFEPNDQDDKNNNSHEPITRSLTHLMHHLSMSESLVRNATTFWIGKLVLKQTASDPSPAYTVLETLDDETVAATATATATADDQEGTTTTTAAAAAIAAAESATGGGTSSSLLPSMIVSEREITQSKMSVYKQYVVGMLTNGGAMPLAQIVMMLKLTVPGGFPFGNEELKEFLDGEVRLGRLGFGGGGVYKVVK